jgi:hypothetical protein
MTDDPRPPVWIGHVMLETERLSDSAAFMRAIGMRPVHESAEVAIFELRGGTHLILLPRRDVATGEVVAGDAPFDLMVDDLHAAHRRFAALGLAPTAIEAVPKIDHEYFRLREPGGHLITVYSSHVSGPV